MEGIYMPCRVERYRLDKLAWVELCSCRIPFKASHLRSFVENPFVRETFGPECPEPTTSYRHADIAMSNSDA